MNSSSIFTRILIYTLVVLVSGLPVYLRLPSARVARVLVCAAVVAAGHSFVTP